ncbi:MAG: acetoin utilization protein AcuC, partial [Burkholderiales bacterium]
MRAPVQLYVGEALRKYGFPDEHPLSIDRQGAFWDAARDRGLDRRAAVIEPTIAAREAIMQFHDEGHVDWVRAKNAGGGLLDGGDTPAFPGVYDAGAAVVGTALAALDAVMSGQTLRTFQPIGGLHHARRNSSAGFCVFNDLGVVIEALRAKHRVTRIGYVDIDVHHGDGVQYSYDDDPELIFADIHQNGRTLYPGTGHTHEIGKGEAEGTKLNLPLLPGAGDREFFEAWERAEDQIDRFAPEIILFQCGADGLAGDPLAGLRYTRAAHAHATKRLCVIAERHCKGRLMAFGGGGYDLGNL